MSKTVKLAFSFFAASPFIFSPSFWKGLFISALRRNAIPFFFRFFFFVFIFSRHHDTSFCYFILITFV